MVHRVILLFLSIQNKKSASSGIEEADKHHRLILSHLPDFTSVGIGTLSAISRQ
jgi:hypothetical protein